MKQFEPFPYILPKLNKYVGFPNENAFTFISPKQHCFVWKLSRWGCFLLDENQFLLLSFKQIC